jgi:hypothetical protein
VKEKEHAIAEWYVFICAMVPYTDMLQKQPLKKLPGTMCASLFFSFSIFFPMGCSPVSDTDKVLSDNLFVYSDTGRIIQQYQNDKTIKLDATVPHGWTNFYRSDDVSSTAYFYFEKPSNNLPALQSAQIRTYNLNNTKR